MAQIAAEQTGSGLPPARRRGAQGFWSRALAAAAVIILANGLFGDRGLTEMLRARHSYEAARADLERLREENAGLRGRVQQLRDDPAAIEAVARGELGLMRRDEILVVVRNRR